MLTKLVQRFSADVGLREDGPEYRIEDEHEDEDEKN
jgi:hypothetical protein